MKSPKPKTAPTWFDPRTGSAPIMLQQHRIGERTFEPARSNCFRIWWIQKGTGKVDVSAGRHPFGDEQLLFFVPYQHFKFSARARWEATEVQFHANFLCVETFHAETGCSGSLFNDLYGPPIVTLDEPARDEVSGLFSRLARELREQEVAFEEASLSWLKILLIIATRQKAQVHAACTPSDRGSRHSPIFHPLIARLRELIEEHYCKIHSPQEFADLLHVTPKTLGRCVREQLGKTLTDLIRERLLTHAKWQLLHTLKPIKEIAREIGFQDELYFSRLFKKATGVSPKFFREFETEIRGGSNLSMSLSAPSIRH